METFFTADTHFGHASILKHCTRPFPSVDEMDSALIENWNSTVSRKDSVYILGDFAFRDHNQYLSRLQGRKILILGNHDKMPDTVLRNFTNIFAMKLIKLNKQEIFLCHYAMRTWQNCHNGSWSLFGHSHGRLQTFNLSLDVGVDSKLAAYKPIPFHAIAQEMLLRQDQMQNSGRITIQDANLRFQQDDLEYMTQMRPTPQ